MCVCCGVVGKDLVLPVNVSQMVEVPASYSADLIPLAKSTLQLIPSHGAAPHLHVNVTKRSRIDWWHGLKQILWRFCPESIEIQLTLHH